MHEVLDLARDVEDADGIPASEVHGPIERFRQGQKIGVDGIIDVEIVTLLGTVSVDRHRRSLQRLPRKDGDDATVAVAHLIGAERVEEGDHLDIHAVGLLIGEAQSVSEYLAGGVRRLGIEGVALVHARGLRRTIYFGAAWEDERN